MEKAGEVVITKNCNGQIVMVSRQDENGRILEILAESESKAAPADDMRDKVTLALGLSLAPKGAPTFAWSYLLDSIRELVKCEEELVLLKTGMEMSKAAPAAVAVPDERAAFEVGILKYTPHAILDCHDGQYVIPWVQAAWTGWQARAALAATPAAATESVLIDGVAYTIPEPVAHELLRLHIELRQAPSPVVLPEPDAVISEVMALVEARCQAMWGIVKAITPKELNDAHRNSVKAHQAVETKLRALLAGVSAPAAQAEQPIATVTRFHDLGGEIDWTSRAIAPVGAKLYLEPQAQADARDAAPAASGQDARVQWWLATLDQYGNPTLTDGAHQARAGADKAAYLIDAMNLGRGKKYAVARVELSGPKPSSDGVNHEAIAIHNRSAQAAQQGGDKQ